MATAFRPQTEVTESGGDCGKLEYHAPSKGESCCAAPANHCHVAELVVYCYTVLFLKESGNKKFYGKTNKQTKKFYGKDLNFLMLETSSNCSKILCRPTG